eukprot:1752894-Prymnesium_polylepis.1
MYGATPLSSNRRPRSSGASTALAPRSPARPTRPYVQRLPRPRAQTLDSVTCATLHSVTCRTLDARSSTRCVLHRLGAHGWRRHQARRGAARVAPPRVARLPTARRAPLARALPPLRLASRVPWRVGRRERQRPAPVLSSLRGRVAAARAVRGRRRAARRGDELRRDGPQRRAHGRGAARGRRERLCVAGHVRARGADGRRREECRHRRAGDRPLSMGAAGADVHRRAHGRRGRRPPPGAGDGGQGERSDPRLPRGAPPASLLSPRACVRPCALSSACGSVARVAAHLPSRAHWRTPRRSRRCRTPHLSRRCRAPRPSRPSRPSRSWAARWFASSAARPPSSTPAAARRRAASLPPQATRRHRRRHRRRPCRYVYRVRARHTAGGTVGGTARRVVSPSSTHASTRSK